MAFNNNPQTLVNVNESENENENENESENVNESVYVNENARALERNIQTTFFLRNLKSWKEESARFIDFYKSKGIWGTTLISDWEAKARLWDVKDNSPMFPDRVMDMLRDVCNNSTTEKYKILGVLSYEKEDNGISLIIKDMSTMDFMEKNLVGPYGFKLNYRPLEMPKPARA